MVSLRFWIVYLLAALFGLVVLAEPFHYLISGHMPGFDAAFCYILGVIVTTAGLAVWRRYWGHQLRHPLIVACVIGVLAFLSGLLVGYAFSIVFWVIGKLDGVGP